MNRLGFGILFVILNISAITGQPLEKCEQSLLEKHLENMEAKKDVTVAPCDDFYTYACGNWDTTYFLRKLGARDTLTRVKAENKLLLIQHFDSTENEDTLDIIPQSGSERKCLLDFYHSCVNLPFSDERNISIQTYANVLKRFSDWPILNPNFSESKANESFNWEYVSAQLRRYGANSFWRTLVQPNWQNAEQLIIYIVPPLFEFLQRSKRAFKRGIVQKNTNSKDNSNDHDDGENDEGDEDDDEVFLYKTYVKYLLLDMGVRMRKVLAYADEIVRFEQELMSLTEADENSMILSSPQTLASLTRELPGIQLQQFFDILFQNIVLPNNYAQKLLIVANKSYLLKLAKLLKKTKADTIGKYLLIQFLVHFEVNLHDEQPYSNRQEHCLQQANTFLPKEMSSLFLDLKHEGRGIEFLRSAQSNLTQMFDNLKLVFESLINETNVFDHDIRTRADGLEKLHAMQLKLPDLETDMECDAFKNIPLNSENYDLNYLYLSQSKVLQELLAVNKSLSYEVEGENSAAENGPKRTKNAHTMFTNYGPLDVNAYYRLKKNAIEIPVGLLSLPIYDNCLEAPMIYGTIAFIVGHELLHGFDYDGLNYDKTGNIADGWDPKSIIAYGTKASCYLGKRYDNAHINVNENIADSEGLRLALGALRKVTGPLQSDDLKLFFTSFAHIWCRSPNEHAERHSLHAAHRERVNNVLGNFQAFAETFECKSGSVMNPLEKCSIW